jgi:hypothetical protein
MSVKTKVAISLLALAVLMLGGCHLRTVEPLRTRYGTVYVYGTPQGGGQVAGGGTYPTYSKVQISASPNTGYAFSQWSDGNLNAVRIVSVTGGTTRYTATFVQYASQVNVLLGWNAEPRATLYRLYQGSATGKYDTWTGTPSTNLTVSVNRGSLTFFAAKSVDAAGLESTNYSNEVSYQAP